MVYFYSKKYISILTLSESYIKLIVSISHSTHTKYNCIKIVILY